MSTEAMQLNEASARYSVTAEAQDVPPGYQRTEVGVIPDDWGIAPLAQLSAFITKGATPTTYGFKWEQSGILFLRSECVSDEGLDLDQSMHISAAAHETLRRSAVRDGDILITITGNVGRVVLLTGVVSANINQHIARIRIAAPSVDTGYVYHFLSQLGVRRTFNSITTGQAYPQISLKQVREAKVALPSEPEQRAIAEALSDVDGLLGALEALIAKKLAIKQAAMQQLLTGKTRLPGFSGEWEAKPIGEFTDCTAGGTPSTLNPEYWGGTIPWMNSGELNLKFVDDVEGRITEKGLRESSTKVVPSRCVLMGLAGQGKTRGTVAMNTVELCTNQSIAAIFPNDAFVAEYLYYNLDARYDELRGMSTGDGGRGGLNLKIIRSIDVLFPSVKEQAAIATVLSEMDAEIAALERHRDKTRAIKQGMMQELLTGRKRLV